MGDFSLNAERFGRANDYSKPDNQRSQKPSRSAADLEHHFGFNPIDLTVVLFWLCGAKRFVLYVLRWSSRGVNSFVNFVQSAF
ncbi:hypothetical protein EF888_00815 [Silicimonas algicola]|uniref:hypothetical protein n=1 Tax=Silicimonas algicola TaxID=1826607 RepID=UPI000F852633|nr:hypothetical protein [Silicimonas algicola]AZQ65800.1 hypothetical protein EF888_00815 [Silicimonas algicola]